jgi:hypothetical protein
MVFSAGYRSRSRLSSGQRKPFACADDAVEQCTIASTYRERLRAAIARLRHGLE